MNQQQYYVTPKPTEVAMSSDEWLKRIVINPLIVKEKNQPNQPAPKSAEEFIRENLYKAELYEDVKVLANLMQTYASQFARYVTDEEIDARWPININMTDKGIAIQELQREAAKAMRDMIFGGVKP